MHPGPVLASAGRRRKALDVCIAPGVAVVQADLAPDDLGATCGSNRDVHRGDEVVLLMACSSGLWTDLLACCRPSASLACVLDLQVSVHELTGAGSELKAHWSKRSRARHSLSEHPASQPVSTGMNGLGQGPRASGSFRMKDLATHACRAVSKESAKRTCPSTQICRVVCSELRTSSCVGEVMVEFTFSSLMIQSGLCQ